MPWTPLAALVAAAAGAPCYRQARKLEGELDVKLVAYNKLCTGFEATYKLKSDNNALGADQVRLPVGPGRETSTWLGTTCAPVQGAQLLCALYN